jgi:hypothetical protein
MTDECVSAILNERERCLRVVRKAIRDGILAARSTGEVERTYAIGADLLAMVCSGVDPDPTESTRATGN